MSTIKDLLNGKEIDGVSLERTYNADIELVNEVYTDEMFSTLFSNDTWIKDLTEGRIVFGFNISGFATSAADREGISKKAAEGIAALSRIPGVASKFAESPEWQKNIFKELVKNSVVAQNAAYKASLFNPTRIDHLIISTQEHFLTQWGNPENILTTDGLPKEQVMDVAYGIHAMENLNKSVLGWVGEDSNLYNKVDDQAKRPLAFQTSTQGLLHASRIINAPNDLASLHEKITKSPHINEGYKAPSSTPSTESASGAQASTEAGQDTAGEKSYVQLADENVASRESALSEIENRLQETRAALEQLEAERAILIEDLNEANSTRDEVLKLESQKADAAKKEELLRGFDDDANTREARVRAALLNRPDEEGPGFSSLEDFLDNVSDLGVKQIAAIYGIDASHFESNYSKFQSLVLTVKNGVDFSLLRAPLVTLFDRIIEDIGPENLKKGRENLEKIIQSTDGIEELETRVRDRLAQDRNLPSEQFTT